MKIQKRAKEGEHKDAPRDLVGEKTAFRGEAGWNLTPVDEQPLTDGVLENLGVGTDTDEAAEIRAEVEEGPSRSSAAAGQGSRSRSAT